VSELRILLSLLNSLNDENEFEDVDCEVFESQVIDTD